MGRRTVLLIAALVVAALGTALVWMYANRADERAQADAAPVEVLVATSDIGAGTSGCCHLRGSRGRTPDAPGRLRARQAPSAT